MTTTTLKFTTIVNGQHKRATTHFGTTYELIKDSTGQWSARVTVPATKRYPGSGGTEYLTDGHDFVSFADARRAANDDFKRNGGR